VEERPEVKKAGGVYYTPTYIVDYIVESTVGKLLEGKTPKQASKLRILDPACGSGSFLLGAYDYLLKWYLHAYIAEGSEKHKDRLYPAGGSWKLTIREKKQILLDNIYGVDIDSQAVEVTKLSLLLKVLEGESEQTAKPRLIKEPALPDLDKNIKCGNSLIGPDFFDKGAKEPVAEEERRQVNAFDWATEFAETAKRGGFDAVIGNPPYIGFHGFSESKAYLKKRFRSARGKFDYYLPFIEAGLSLLLKGGRLGFICPTNFMKREHGLGLRKLLRTDTSIQQIVDFEDVQVFEGALNYTGVFILSRQEPSQDHIFPYRRRALEATPLNVSQKVLTDDVWVFRDDSRELVVTKMRAQTVTSLGDLVQGISEGIVTGHNDVFFVDAAQAKKGRFESDVLKPCLRGSEIRRYFAEEPHHKVVYPYKLVDGVTTVITEADLRKYPRLLSYLSECRRKLSGRSYFEESSKHWYELWCQRDLNLLATEKIVVPELAESSRFALADNSVFYGDTVCGIVPLPSIPERVEYLLALLNSKLMDFYYKATTVPKANRFYIYKTMFLRKVPIRRIDFKNDEESRCHERLVGFAKEMLASSSRLAKALTGHESTSIQRQIEATDRHIDQLVYKLYKLTPEEIALVEGYPAEPLKVQ